VCLGSELGKCVWKVCSKCVFGKCVQELRWESMFQMCVWEVCSGSVLGKCVPNVFGY